MNEIILMDELEGVDQSKAAQIKAVFQPMVNMLEDFEGEYNGLMATEQTNEKSAKAKKLRLRIARVRIESDKVRKSQKEKYLRAGNAIQGIHNVLKFAVVDKEEKLREVETFYERIETERIARIRYDRESELMRYESSATGLDIGRLSEDAWENYISGVKLNYEKIKEAQRKAEEERIENERKTKLCREREMQLAKYEQFGGNLIHLNTTQSEFETLLLNLENKKKEHEEEQARIKLENEKLKAERETLEKESKERESELKSEREKRVKMEKESQENLSKAQEKKRRLDLAPDKEKLLNFAGTLYSGMSSIKSQEAKKALSQAINTLTSAANKM